MKRFIPLFALVVLSACTVYNVEPRYDSRDKITGSYDVEEYSHTWNDNTYYTMRIVKSGSDYSDIYIRNFYGADIEVYAYVNYDKITIPYQVVDGYEVEGTGTIYGSRMEMNYSVRDTYEYTETDFCEMTAWR